MAVVRRIIFIYLRQRTQTEESDAHPVKPGRPLSHKFPSKLYCVETSLCNFPMRFTDYAYESLVASPSVHPSNYGSAALLDLSRFFSFLIYTHSVGLLGRGSASRMAATCTQNKCTQISMSRARLEPTIPVLEWVKTVHTSDRAATVICWSWYYLSFYGTRRFISVFTRSHHRTQS
jgi:hypothetical protein